MSDQNLRHSYLNTPVVTVRCDSEHSGLDDYMKHADNMGTVWRNHPAVQIQERRRRTDAPPDHEIDWVGIWLVIVAIAVVVAVFGGTLFGDLS